MKGIGKKSYEQCIGFLKILPDCSQNVNTKGCKSENDVIVVNDDDDGDDDFDASKGSKRKRPQKKSGSKRSKSTCSSSSGYNYLDATLIHPESYRFAEK